MRVILALLLTVACASSPSPRVTSVVAVPVSDPAASIDRSVLDATASVIVSCLDATRNRMGAGVAISPRHVITSRHLAEACLPDEATVILARTAVSGYVEVVVDGLAEVDAARLVVVGTAEPFTAWAELADRGPEPVEPVCVAAWDFALATPLLKCGRASVGLPDGTVVIGVRVIPGNSGSAVYDTDGDVVGLVRSRPKGAEPDESGIAVPSPAWAVLGRPP